jgi:superfamily II DNA or RNA helicase
LETEHFLPIIGLNCIKRILELGIQKYKCDEFDCVSYNINVDYLLDIIDLNQIKCNIYSNTENMYISSKNKDKFLKYIDKSIFLFHVSNNINIIHAKIYRFKKQGNNIFLAIGSGNFSRDSNNNIESFVLITEQSLIQNIWNLFHSNQDILNYSYNNIPPENLLKDTIEEIQIEDSFLCGLWEHQKVILKWLLTKSSSIINIPPGTGKTEISLKYIEYLSKKPEVLTIIILVPTIALIEQWKLILSNIGYECYELTNDFSNLKTYFPNPKNKILVTLYSRFYELDNLLFNKIRVTKPNILIILDECHNIYGNVDILNNFYNRYYKLNAKIFQLALSATLDTFNIDKMNRFIDYMGGRNNIYEINLQSFFSKWNNLNDNPILKEIDYFPIYYNLTDNELQQYESYSQKIAAQMSKSNILGEFQATAAIQRAQWLRGLDGGINSLNQYIETNIDLFKTRSTIIFVQTNEIATNLQKTITDNPSWDKRSSIYIYDSSKNELFKQIAMSEFKSNLGFCLISEQILAEGFDLPKIDAVILHGSHRSERDWIQKIGRAIRYNPLDPLSIAKIIDIVFCDPKGIPLPLEQERFNVLSSISR